MLVDGLGIHSPAMEAFRALRTNIHFAGVKAPLKSILVTSAEPGDGKSSVAANLAVVMALGGASVILVDADMRKPALSRMFGFKPRVGLTNVLLGTLRLDEVLSDTRIGGLKLCPSGTVPPNPAELMGSGAMTELLEKLEGKADLVILDSPPLLPVTDAALLAGKVDGALLVVRAGKTQRQTALQAKEALEHARTRVLGVVVNDLKQVHDAAYYGYYGNEKPGAEKNGRGFSGHSRTYTAGGR